MIDTILGALVGWVVCKLLGSFQPGEAWAGLFHAAVDTKPVTVKDKEASKPGLMLTSTAATFPSVQPAGLPPWPSGWRSAKTATPAMVDRAWALLPVLKTGERKVEQGEGGAWLSYYKSKNASTGKTGVTVFVPRTTAPAVVPVTV